MEIGIPRALLYHRYHKLWITFFRELGAEITISPRTNKEILKAGVKIAVDELCLPVKLFIGHLTTFRDCDYVFVPRIVSLRRGTCTCPKFIALPDIIRYLLDTKILTITIDARRVPIPISMFLLGLKLNKNPLKVLQAYKKAKLEYKRSKTLVKTDGGEITVGIIGHVYTIHDEYINMNLIKKLEGLGVNIITSVPKKEIRRFIQNLPHIYWYYEEEIVGTAYYFIHKKLVDGIIYLISFGCGPSSLISEQITLEAKHFKMPLLKIVLDEHQSQAWFNTRLEAFIDLIKRKK